MLRSARTSGDFVTASILAVMIAGGIYIGIILLNVAETTSQTQQVEGSIRLAQTPKETPIEPLKRKKLQETKPPQKLPKTFSSKAKSKPVKPILNMHVPNFSANMHPGLKGGIAMPDGNLGGIGFTMDEVDDAPQVLRSIPPEYPYGAKRNRIVGKVVVRMLVTYEGLPTNLSIHSAIPSGVFDTAALSAAKRWKFRPGQYKGKAVDTWVLLPFNFELAR